MYGWNEFGMSDAVVVVVAVADSWFSISFVVDSLTNVSHSPYQLCIHCNNIRATAWQMRRQMQRQRQATSVCLCICLCYI